MPHVGRGHRLNPYSHVQVVGGAYIPPVAPSEWSHQRLRYYRITGENAAQSVFSTMKIRHSRVDSTWVHNFGCSLDCIESIINFLKGDLLRRNKHALPQEDCMLLFLKWLKWNQSYQLLGEPFKLNKSRVSPSSTTTCHLFSDGRNNTSK